MIPGLALLALSGLMLWRGFTGQSPVEEVRKLLDGEAIFVKGDSSLTGRMSGGGTRTDPVREGGGGSRVQPEQPEDGPR